MRQPFLLGALALLLVLPIWTAAAAPPAPPAIAPDTVAGWIRPLDGELVVTRAFDLPAQPWLRGHRGVDLAGVPGQQVLAAGAGTVVFAGQVAGRPVVSIDHPGGLRTTYEPVGPTVGAGQVVVRGSPIGTLAAGHEGCPVEACLHWGLRRDETYLDPLTLLASHRVRLLPLVSGG